jgi:cytochrome P450
VRWTSPAIQFTPLETAATERQKIRAGELLGLFYHRDEDVFEAPFSFDIPRYPNRHIAFGIGESGAALELQVMFGQSGRAARIARARARSNGSVQCSLLA